MQDGEAKLCLEMSHLARVGVGVVVVGWGLTQSLGEANLSLDCRCLRVLGKR